MSVAAWPTRSLEECCDLIAGFAFPSSGFSDDPTDVPLVKGSNVVPGGIAWQEGPWWPLREADRLARFWLKPGDAVLAMDRPIVQGKLKLAWLRESDPRALLVQRVARLRAVGGMDGCFLRYVLSSPAFHQHVQTITTGANVPHISGPDILRFRFACPPEDTQVRIGDLLATYDDLIAANERRMALLEESVHLLYREWFERLRFPGHEWTPTADSVLSGWRRSRVDAESAVLTRGISPRYSEASSAIVLNQKCIRDRRIALGPSRTHASEVPESKRIREWDVLVNSTGVGTLGRVAQVNFVPDQMTVDSHVTVVRAKPDVDPLWFGLALERYEATISGMGHGATGQTELRRGELGALPLVVPSDSVQQQWAEQVRPHRLLVRALLAQNAKLREARDYLLPRLMSGQLTA